MQKQQQALARDKAKYNAEIAVVRDEAQKEVRIESERANRHRDRVEQIATEYQKRLKDVSSAAEVASRDLRSEKAAERS